MSEAVAATTATGSSSVTPETSAPSGAKASGSNSGANDDQISTGAVKAQDKAVSGAEDEFEEITMGSIKGKVPKALAKALKDYERGAQAKFRHAAETIKTSEQRAQERVMQMAKTNPKEFLRKTGIDPDEFAEATMVEKIQLMQESPEQRELRELKTWKASQDEQAKKEKEEADKKEMASLEEKEAKSLEDEMLKAFQTSGLPRNRFYMQQVAAKMYGARMRNEDLSAAEAAAKVREEFELGTRGVLEDTDVSTIQKLLGDKVLNKLREAFVAQATGQKQAALDQGATRPGATPETMSTQGQKMNERQWREFWNK